MHVASEYLDKTRDVGSDVSPETAGASWWLMGIATSLAIGLVGFGYFREMHGVIHAFDTGLYMQIFENLRLHRDLASSVTGESNFLAHHFQPILLFIWPLYSAFPSATTLFVLDGFCVLLSIFILMHGRARRISHVFACSTVGGILLHPTIAGRLFYSFVPETLALPFLVIQAKMLLRKAPLDRRDLILFFVAQILAGSCKENIWLVNGFSSAILMWRFRREKVLAWTTGTMAVIHVSIFIYVFFFWMPAHTNLPRYYALSYYQNPTITGHSAVDLCRAMFANLISIRSLQTLLVTAALCGFIPCLGLSPALAAALPGLFMMLTTSASHVHNPGNHYQILCLPFLWANGLKLLDDGVVKRILPRIFRFLPLALVAAPLLMTVKNVTGIFRDIRVEPRTQFIQSQMAAVRAAIPDKDQAMVAIDGNLQPFLADYRHVFVLLQFKANPHTVSASDWDKVTDVVTAFDPRTLSSCEEVAADAGDVLDYDYQAFYRYCNFMRKTSFDVTSYPESGILHFRRHPGRQS